MKKDRKYWSGKFITKLEHNQVFCMGTNPEGRHGAGAAKAGMEFGAQYGKGRGLVGNTYGLITKNLTAGFIEKETGITYQTEGYKSVSEFDIRKNIADMYEYAKQFPNKEFLLAYSYDTWANGNPKKSLNGYTSMEMANMLFDNQNIPDNIVFHDSFKPVFEMKMEGKTPSEIVQFMKNQTNQISQAGQRKREGMAKLSEAYNIAKETGNVRIKQVKNGVIENQPTHGGFDYDEAIKQDNQPRENFTFFWHSPSPFSQWHPSIFVVKNKQFISGEQFMMYCKAKLFKDEEIAEQLLELSNSYNNLRNGDSGIVDSMPNNIATEFALGYISKSDILNDKDKKYEWDLIQKEIKKLGRKVKKYDENTWNQHKRSYVAKGNYEKFTQNPELKQAILNTVNTIMVEANPFDKLSTKYDPNATSPSKWKGQNILGKILTNLREKLILDMNNNLNNQKRNKIKP